MGSDDQLAAPSSAAPQSPESYHSRTIRFSELACIMSSVRSLDLTEEQAADALHVIPGVARFGDVILGQVETLGVDDRLEQLDGTYKTFLPGDLMIGVIGNRYSTTSFYGGVPLTGIKVPTEIAVDLLSTGGVVGVCESFPSYEGHPTKIQILGLVAKGGKLVNLLSHLRTAQQLTYNGHLILIAGTAAGVGKTTFAMKLIGYLSHVMRWHVAATKLAGAGEYADLLSLRDAGAKPVLDFVDVGLPTTYDVPERLIVPAIKSVLNQLGEGQPDVIVAELGGDILGAHVPDILADAEIRRITRALVLVPSDMLAAYGAMTVLKDMHFPAPIYLGQPVRNPEASRERARALLKRPMFDCMIQEDLCTFVRGDLGWSEKSTSSLAPLAEDLACTF